MDALKIKVFINAIINFANLGYLNLDNQSLVYFYEECLIMTQYLGDIPTIVAVCVVLGQFHAEKFHFTKPLIWQYENLLKFAEQRCDKSLRIVAYKLMEQTYAKLCKYREAISCCEKCLDIVIEIGDKRLEGHVYGNLGSHYKDLNSYDEAILYSQKSLDIAKKLDDKVGMAVALLNLGTACQCVGEIQKSVHHHKDSLKVAKEIGDRKLEGRCYINLGLSFQRLGDNDSAIRHCRKALDICKEIGDKEGQILSLCNIGVVYRVLGKYQEAISYHETSLDISKEIGNKEGEGHAYTNLGGITWALGRYYESQTYLEKALKVFQEIGDKRSEAEVYKNLSGLHLQLGKEDESRKYNERSFDIVKEVGDKRELVNSYGNLGMSFHNRGEFQKALNLLKKSVEIAKDVGDRLGESSAYTRLGSVYMSLRNYAEGIMCQRKSMSIATENGYKEGEALAYREMGTAYRSIGKFREAILCFEKSVHIARETCEISSEGRAYHGLGVTFHMISVLDKNDQHAKEKSIHFLKEALRCCDWEFDHLQNLDDFKISITETFINTSKLLTKILINDKQFGEALMVCDRERGRALRDLLALKYGLNPENAFRTTSPLAYPADINTLASGKYCILFLEVGAKEINMWILSQQKPLFFTKSEGALSLQTTFKSEERHQMTMTQILTEIICETFLKTNDHSMKYENRSLESSQSGYPTTTDIVDANVVTLPASVKERDMISTAERKLELLFNLLITPVQEKLEKDEIVIIPNGPLYKVPFAALSDPATGLRLYETKRIRIVPSLSILKTLQDCPSDFHSKKGALIVGDPDVGEVLLKGEKRLLTRLPSAKHEAEIIGGILDAEPFIGSQATKDMVKQKLKEGAAVIHIAAHGDSENGHIALAPSSRTEAKIPEEQDYMLTMQEVQEIGVKAQLVVLSCCHSGRGEIKSEGVVGLSRAFLAAGARAVVASLWAVYDDATLSFMVSFYTYLKQGERASKCLQLAMKEIREEVSDEPKYWASFFLIGDDVIISLT